jgi:hypothetical protein
VKIWKNQAVKAVMSCSAQSSCMNGRHYPIPNQWGIEGLETTIEIDREGRSILAGYPSTIRLMDIAGPKEGTAGMVGRLGEDNSSCRRT